MQRLCKPRAEYQACLNVLLRCSQSYAKIVQTESRTSSLIEYFAEVQPILCKDCANRIQSSLLELLRCSQSSAKIKIYVELNKIHGQFTIIHLKSSTFLLWQAAQPITTFNIAKGNHSTLRPAHNSTFNVANFSLFNLLLQIRVYILRRLKIQTCIWILQ